MSYCQITDVKKILLINPEETTYDTEIKDCIDSADGYIDDLAAGNGLTIPDPTPQTVKDASKWFAAHFFRSKRSPPPDKPVFWVLGMNFLKAWLGTKQVGRID